MGDREFWFRDWFMLGTRTFREGGVMIHWLRGGQTFPKSTEIRNSVAFRAVFSVFFRPNFSVWQNRFPSSFCSSHDVLTYWEANSG